MSALTDTAPAKINLTLRVLGRRADGYHLLESLVVFASVADRLTLAPDTASSIETSGPFAAACGPPDANLVLKALRCLGERVEGLKAGRFTLDKNLPVAAGIGGGSSDAAAALRLLARLNGVAPDDPRLAEAARATGADVPVCLDPRTRIMRGIGEILSEPLALPLMPAVLVNPGVPLATRDVFAALKERRAGGPPLGALPQGKEAVLDFLQLHGNDLTPPAIACAPVIANVLSALGALPGARLARMSGSGPTCLALFQSAGAATAAAQQVAQAHKDWWVRAGTLG